MIKVLIADDESLQRQLVQSIIDWDKLDLEVAGEAEDGLQTVAMAEQLQPGIIIMDINMPFINGIEASKRIKQFIPETQILILTAYGEFDYAKEALHIGIVGYFLKPLDPEELTAGLIKAKITLLEQWEKQQNFETLQKENQHMEKERFLLEKLTCFSDCVENSINRWDEYGFSHFRRFCLFDFIFDKFEIRDELQEEMEECIRERFPQAEILQIDNTLLIILFCEGTEEAFTIQIQSLKIYLRDSVGIRITCGISAIHDDLNELWAAYQEVKIAQQQATHEGEFCQYELQTLHSFIKAISYQPEQLLNNLRAKHFQEVFDQIHRCFVSIEQDGDFSKMGFYFAMNMLVTFSLYLLELDIDLSGELEGEKKIMERLCHFGKPLEIENELRKVLEKGIHLLELKSCSSTKRKAEGARVFINQNFRRYDLGLLMVAENVGVNACYLSSIFKSEFGCSLTRYIMKNRLEYARNRLKEDPDATVTSVAEESGYTDVFYFSKSFKKYYGSSPSRYLEDHNK